MIGKTNISTLYQKFLTKRAIYRFTLFELLVVIALVGAAFGLIAIQVPKALKKERFETTIEQVIAKISLAQELMIDYHTDVDLTFAEQPKGVACHITVNQPLPAKLTSHLSKHQLIEGIDTIAFNEKPSQVIHLLFDATLGATPKGRFFLAAKECKATLILRGFPSKILRGNHEIIKEDNPLYPEEILYTL